jgi:predicted amidohydrolase
MRVSLVQLRVDDAEPREQRIDRAQALVAAERGHADLVVLPELWVDGPFATAAAIAGAEPLDGPIVSAMARLAGRAGVLLHAGSFAETNPRAPDRPFNTSVLCTVDGHRLAKYRKLHLFGFDSGEAASFSAGAHPVSAGPWGLATCYDLRFPELFRDLVDRGALAFLVATGWPAARIEHWTALARARAIEDQAWFIGANSVGVNGGVLLGGRSLVVAPTGEVVAQAGASGEEVLRVEVDLAAAEQCREQFPVLRDRRSC